LTGACWQAFNVLLGEVCLASMGIWVFTRASIGEDDLWCGHGGMTVRHCRLICGLCWPAEEMIFTLSPLRFGGVTGGVELAGEGISEWEAGGIGEDPLVWDMD
jgi:hypothetical protein